MSLLVSDLDGTLLGDERALDGFAVWFNQVKSSIRLVYSSGRFLDSVFKSIDKHCLPMPDAIICGVGTEIYEMPGGKRLLGWPELTYNWNPYVVRATCAAHSELRVQPEHLLSHYKVSFYGEGLDDAFLGHLARQLAWVEQDVSIIYSSNRDLDILPSRTNKGTAAEFVARRWGFPRDQVIVAGDSGNDLAMFRSGFRGIVVGNAQPELIALRVPSVYRATTQYAAGVLEGLDYWLDEFWLANPTDDRLNLDQDASRGRRV